jgi:hypothetical protein
MASYKQAPGGPKLPLMIHVTAPATLPAGYTFEAQINGDEHKIVTIEVVRASMMMMGVDGLLLPNQGPGL